jgi:hypothetical protein
VVGVFEQVRVDLQGDVRVGVAELAADVDDVQAFGDQERGEAVAERVERELARRVQVRSFDGLAEAFADVAVVESAAERVREDEVMRGLVVAGEPALAECFRKRGGARTTSRLPASVLSGAWACWRER